MRLLPPYSISRKADYAQKRGDQPFVDIALAGRQKTVVKGIIWKKDINRPYIM